MQLQTFIDRYDELYEIRSRHVICVVFNRKSKRWVGDIGRPSGSENHRRYAERFSISRMRDYIHYWREDYPDQTENLEVFIINTRV